MSRLVKLAPLQAPLRHVKQPAHNADFFRLRISKIPANAQKRNAFPARPLPDFVSPLKKFVVFSPKKCIIRFNRTFIDNYRFLVLSVTV